MIIIDNEKYYNIKEISIIFNKSVQTIHNWINHNQLKCNRISNRKIIISEKNIKDFLNGKENI